MKESYLSVQGVAENTIVIERSKFICTLREVADEEAAKQFIAGMRKTHSLATHNCYAYIADEIGNVMKYSDDGEPQGSAGIPTLDVLRKSGVSNAVIVTTRYFGGILLGTGGLVRAYTAAGSGALQQAELVSMRLVVDCSVRVSYAQFEQAQRIIAAAETRLDEPVFDDAVTLCWRMPAGQEGALCTALNELTRGGAEVEISKPQYAPF